MIDDLAALLESYGVSHDVAINLASDIVVIGITGVIISGSIAAAGQVRKVLTQARILKRLRAASITIYKDFMEFGASMVREAEAVYYNVPTYQPIAAPVGPPAPVRMFESICFTSAIHGFLNYTSKEYQRLERSFDLHSVTLAGRAERFELGPFDCASRVNDLLGRIRSRAADVLEWGREIPVGQRLDVMPEADKRRIHNNASALTWLWASAYVEIHSNLAAAGGYKKLIREMHGIDQSCFGEKAAILLKYSVGPGNVRPWFHTLDGGNLTRELHPHGGFGHFA